MFGFSGLSKSARKYPPNIRVTIKSVAERVGWSKEPQESHQRTLLRSVVLYGYGTNGDRKTIQKNKKLTIDIGIDNLFEFHYNHTIRELNSDNYRVELYERTLINNGLISNGNGIININTGQNRRASRVFC